MKKLLLFLALLLPLHAKEPKKVQGWWDIAPREYPDLAISFTAVPDEENGLLDLTDIAANLDENETFDNLEHAHKTNKKVDIEKLEEFLKTQQETSKAITDALAKKYFQTPKPPKFDTSFPHAFSPLQISKFLNLKHHFFLETGRINDAINTIEQLNLLEEKLFSANGTLVSLLITAAVDSSQAELIIRTLQNKDLNSEQLKRVAALFPTSNSFHAQAIQAINSEFFFTSDASYALHTARPGDNEVIDSLFSFDFTFDSEPSLDLAGLLMKLAVHFTHQPNKTIHLYADALSNLKKDLARPIHKRVKPQWKSPKHSRLTNMAGNMFARMSIPPVCNAFYEATERFSVRLNTLQLLIALRHYQLDHGELPEDLNQLIPVYLKQLPLDPFSAKPLHYSKKRKLIWSIGDDFKDNNGVSLDDRKGKNPRPLDGLRNLDEPSASIPF